MLGGLEYWRNGGLSIAYYMHLNQLSLSPSLQYSINNKYLQIVNDIMYAEI